MQVLGLRRISPGHQSLPFVKVLGSRLAPKVLYSYIFSHSDRFLETTPKHPHEVKALVAGRCATIAAKHHSGQAPQRPGTKTAKHHSGKVQQQPSTTVIRLRHGQQHSGQTLPRPSNTGGRAPQRSTTSGAKHHNSWAPQRPSTTTAKHRSCHAPQRPWCPADVLRFPCTCMTILQNTSASQIIKSINIPIGFSHIHLLLETTPEHPHKVRAIWLVIQALVSGRCATIPLHLHDNSEEHFGIP